MRPFLHRLGVKTAHEDIAKFGSDFAIDFLELSVAVSTEAFVQGYMTGIEQWSTS